MSGSAASSKELSLSNLPDTIRDAGIAGAGGAGFPTYAKWERSDDVQHLLVNHQESEPNYFIDKWIGKEHAAELGSLFDVLLQECFDTIVIAAKQKDRGTWLQNLESAVDGTVLLPDDLPADFDSHSGVIFAYTGDKFQYGMESVLLNVVADTTIGNDLPMDHGWIVQNTETLSNIYQAVSDGEPVTRKYVHIDGNTPTHRFLDAPIGTPFDTLLQAAGRSLDDLTEDETVVTGGPGWCFGIEGDLETYGIQKRTNCLMPIDTETVEANKLGGGRVQLTEALDWHSGSVDQKPTEEITPEQVHIPLITNPDIDHIVTPSEPVVEIGDVITEGELIARAGEGISIPQHASISGIITEVTDSHVTIDRE